MKSPALQPPKQRTPTAPGAPPATDGELLMRFSRHGDQAAFAEVVRRHEAMIWGVCTRVLVRRSDAEDAYQATLLILAQKARSVRANDSAGGWLLRVAHNTAISALRRRKALRETTLEPEHLPPEAPLPDLERRRLVGALMEELRTLPAKYQTPLVLRYMEGRSRREIAAAMDQTVATVAGQLVRGRRLLRSRLARRGVSLSLVLGALGSGAATAATLRPPSCSTNPVLLASNASHAATALASQGVRSMFYASATKPAAFAIAATIAVAATFVEPPEGAAQAVADNRPVLLARLDAPLAEEEAPESVQVAKPRSAGRASVGGRTGGGGRGGGELGGGFDGGLGGEFGGASEISGAGGRSRGRAAESTAPTDDATSEFAGGREGSEAGQDDVGDNPIEKAREEFAKKAAAYGHDLGQPGFDELYWQREHWEAKRERAIIRMQQLKNLIANDDPDTYYSDLESEHAEQMLANAKIAEIERMMMQAAVREQPGATSDEEVSVSSNSVRFSSSTGGTLTVGPAGSGDLAGYVLIEEEKQDSLQQPDNKGTPGKGKVSIAGGALTVGGISLGGPAPNLPKVGPIQVGEVLSVEVYEVIEDKMLLQKAVVVDRSGKIALGAKWGRVEVAGVDLDEAEGEILIQYHDRWGSRQNTLKKIASEEGRAYEAPPTKVTVQVTRAGSATEPPALPFADGPARR